MVTAPVLLRGAWYALEQCGHLLVHADRLYQSGAYSSSVILALLSREELGRHQILLDQWRKVQAGGAIPTVQTVRNTTKDHVEKQQRGQILVRIVRDSIAAMGLATVFKREANVVPSERHAMRMRATYVDLEDTGADWRRPAQVGRDEAVVALEDATNDYLNVRLRLERATPGTSQADALAALQEWPGRPPLPEVLPRECER